MYRSCGLKVSTHEPIVTQFLLLTRLQAGSIVPNSFGTGIGQYNALAFAKHGARPLTITDINRANLRSTMSLP